MNAQFSAQTGAGLGNDPDWWRGGVIYQIYPRSFQDSNDDGIGDLKGITQRLHYVASLGVDAIWISPFFKSPMADFGYDVSDYCDIDPMFGTMADFDEMLAAAHHLGVRVIIDLVFRTVQTSILGSKKVAPTEPTQSRIGMSGLTRKRTAPRPTTGCRSSVVQPGNGIRAASSITCTTF